MSISTRVRFEIFKRDGFCCVYCGASPLKGPLHVDHVVAKANGGSDEASNLLTACASCNLGKSAVPLDRKRYARNIATEADRDHSQQILEYLEIQKGIAEARREVVSAVAQHWLEMIGPISEEMYGHLSRIIREWPIEKVYEAIDITAAKMGRPGEGFDSHRAVNQGKYFHGILRRWRDRGVM